jgi:tetratricopeptide (TPR) repeat protein
LLATAAYHTYVTEALDSAIVAYEGVLSLYPSDPIAGNNLAVLYGERDHLDKAVDLYLVAIQRGHAPAVAYTNATVTLFEMGQADSARVILERFREAYPDHPQVMQYSAALASARFDYQEAEDQAGSLLESQAGNSRWEMWAEAELGNDALIQGRLNEGAERILRARALQEESGARFTDLARPVLEVLGTASIQYFFLQDAQGAGHTLDHFLETTDLDSFEPAARGYLDLATLYGHLGRAERAQELLSRFQSQVPPEGRGKGAIQAEVRFAEAAVAESVGDTETALALIREGRALAPDCDLCGLVEMGDAFRAAELPDSAVAAYESYLETPTLFRSPSDNVNLHRALLGLAEIHEEMGRPQQAADFYNWQLQLWSEADPGLQPRVRVLVEKLRDLRGPLPPGFAPGG